MGFPYRQTVYLYFTACIVNLAMFAGTLGLIWTSSAIPRLRANKPGNPLGKPITPNQTSFLASLYMLGALIAPFLSGPTAKKTGHKTALVIFTFPIIICFLLKAFGTHIYLYYIARILGGITSGSVMVLIPCYIGEIAEKHNRGILISVLRFFNVLATFHGYLVGSYTSIKWFSLSGLIAPVVLCIVAPWGIPESPYYYLQRHDEDKAIRCLKKLRHKTDEEIMEEIEEIKRTIECHEQVTIKAAFASQTFRKTLTIVTVIGVVAQLTAVYAISAYLHTIFYTAGTIFSPEICTVIIACTKFISFIPAIIIVDRIGRRLLLIQSGVGVLIALLSLGAFLIVKEQGYDVSKVQCLPLISLVFFVLVYNLGLGVIPSVLLSELFSHSSKWLATIISITIVTLVSFLMIFSFPLLVHGIGMGLFFVIFSLSGLICVLFTYFCIPETIGKTLYEIQIMFKA